MKRLQKNQDGKYLKFAVWVPLVLIMFQLIYLFVDTPLTPVPKLNGTLIAIYCYLSLSFSLLFIAHIIKSKAIQKEKPSVHRINFWYWFFAIALIYMQIIPAIKFIMLLGDMSLGQLREYSIYGGDVLKEKIYHGKLGMMLGRYFAPEMAWLLLSFILFSKCKYRNTLIVLCSFTIVFSNVAVGGRTGLYFLLVTFLMYLLIGLKRINIRVLFIILVFILMALLFSFTIQYARSGDEIFNPYDYVEKIVRYHYVPSIVFATQVDSSDLVPLGFDSGPFAYSLGALMTPYAFLFGGGWQDVPLFRLWDYLNNPLLYSTVDYGVYNAFGTIFIALYLDFGYLSFLAVPAYIAFFIICIQISGIHDKRPMYLWMLLLIYQSLFQPMMNSFFTLLVMVTLLCFGFFRMIILSIKKKESALVNSLSENRLTSTASNL